MPMTTICAARRRSFSGLKRPSTKHCRCCTGPSNWILVLPCPVGWRRCAMCSARGRVALSTNKKGDDHLHSVYMRDYVWHSDEPASGDVRTDGIYSFRDAVRAREYRYDVHDGPLLFGKVKIWGEV